VQWLIHNNQDADFNELSQLRFRLAMKAFYYEN